MDEHQSELIIDGDVLPKNWMEMVGVPSDSDAATMLTHVIDPTSVYRKMFDKKNRSRYPVSEDPNINNMYDEHAKKRVSNEINALTRTSGKLQILRDRATKIIKDHPRTVLGSWYQKTAKKMLKQAILEAIRWRGYVVESLSIESNTSIEDALTMIKKMFEDKEKTQWTIENSYVVNNKYREQSIQIETFPGGHNDQTDTARIGIIRDANSWNIVGVDITELFSYTRFKNEGTLPIIEFAKSFPEGMLEKFVFSGSGYATTDKIYPNGVAIGSRLHDYGEMQFWFSSRLKAGSTLSEKETLDICKAFLSALKENPRESKRIQENLIELVNGTTS